MERLSQVPPHLLHTMQQVGVDLYRHGLVTSHGGNLSLREPQGMWITGTGAMLGRLEARQISFVAHGGEHSGPPPSSDTYLHATTYALSGANAVVHAHPRHAVAVTFQGDSFVPPDFEGQHFLGDVPVIDNDGEAIQRVATALQSRLVVILRGHGAYARGQDAFEALHWIMALEESAEIAYLRKRWES